MPSWPRINWDAGDLSQLSTSIDFLDKNPQAKSKYKKASQLPLVVLGAPGGWALYPTLVFYGALVSLAILVELRDVFAALWILPALMVVTIISFSYGTLRDAKLSLIRLQVLRVLRSKPDTWRRFVVKPAASYLNSLSAYEAKPGRIRSYLNKVKSLNTADEFFEKYSRTFTVFSLASGIVFLYAGGAILALTFLASIVGWMAIIPLSLIISAWADAVRSEVPKVWHSEDLKVLTGAEEAIQ